MNLLLKLKGQATREGLGGNGSLSEHASDLLLKPGMEKGKTGCYSISYFIEPNQFVQFARDLGYQESRKGYVSKCDLCLDLRKYLCFIQDFEELNPKEFYAHLG